MIVTRSESNVHLTYTLDEHKEFSCAIEAFRRAINATLRKEISNLRFLTRELNDEFIESLESLEHTMIIARSNTGIQLTFDIHEFAEFIENIELLRIFLNDFRKWYHDRGEYEKANVLENSQNLFDRVIVLLGMKPNVEN